MGASAPFISTIARINQGLGHDLANNDAQQHEVDNHFSKRNEAHLRIQYSAGTRVSLNAGTSSALCLLRSYCTLSVLQSALIERSRRGATTTETYPASYTQSTEASIPLFSVYRLFYGQWSLESLLLNLLAW